MKEVTTFNLVGAAKRIGVGPTTIRYWIIMGYLPAETVRNHWVIREDDLLKADKAAKVRSRAGRRGPRGTYTPNAKS